MSLRPDETDLIGNWIKSGDNVVGDSIEVRIGQLIANDLRMISVNPKSGGWEILYRDFYDGRYWELTHPHSEMHGGGPRRLTCISIDQAKNKYQI
jgi:hypothetical protein